MKKRLFFGLILSILAVPLAAATAPIGIIGALKEEVRLLENKLQDKQVAVHLGLEYVSGKLNGRPVVIVRSGMGKVNAAAATAVLLDRFKPSAVLFTGIAGGIDPALHPGDLVIGDKLIQHDYGICESTGFKTRPTVNAIDDRPNPLIFNSDPGLIKAAQAAAAEIRFTTITAGKVELRPQINVGTIVTGDVFVASSTMSKELHLQFKAMAVEMEGAAVAQVCFQQRCPFLVIRSLSDSADNEADADIARFYRTAAENSARLTEKLIQLLPPQLN